MNNLLESLINQQFEMAGYNTSQINYKLLLENNKEEEISDNPWFRRYTISEDKYEEFKTWAVNKISKELKINKYKGKFSANNKFLWFDLTYGLKIK